MGGLSLQDAARSENQCVARSVAIQFAMTHPSEAASYEAAG